MRIFILFPSMAEESIHYSDIIVTILNKMGSDRYLVFCRN